MQELFAACDVICHFTDPDRKEAAENADKARRIDLSQIGGTNGYCSEEAAGQIRKALAPFGPEGTHDIGDGNRHYLTFFWLEKIGEPFDLIVFDHHTDMQPAALLPLLSCGNWILESLEKIPDLQTVCLIGPPDEACPECVRQKDRVCIIPMREADTGPFSMPCAERPVYISVDLDVLSPDAFESIWDQGTMTVPRLKEWIRRIREAKRVIGMDLCG